MRCRCDVQAWGRVLAVAWIAGLVEVQPQLVRPRSAQTASVQVREAMPRCSMRAMVSFARLVEEEQLHLFRVGPEQVVAKRAHRLQIRSSTMRGGHQQVKPVNPYRIQIH